jgi:hypothetical protein
VILSTQKAQSLGDISCCFVARDDILGKLDTCFQPRDTRGKPRREFLLYGLGGVGKTQIALKAADNLEKRHVTYIFFKGILGSNWQIGSNTSSTSTQQLPQRFIKATPTFANNIARDTAEQALQYQEP